MICHLQWFRDLERWIPGGDSGGVFEHPMVPLEDLLKQRQEKVTVQEDLGDWQPITIHFDGSVDARQRTAVFKGHMFAAFPGDLVFSKIDLRNGAITVIPQEFPKVVVTSEYPIHIPDREQVDGDYLRLILRTPEFLYRIKQASSGTSGRKRITPEDFRAFEVPLPEPPHQRRLVAAYNRALDKARKLEAEAEKIEKRAVRQFEAALGLVPPPDLPHRPFQIARFKDADRWSHEGILQRALLGDSPPESRYEIVELGDIADVSYGIQKCPSNRPGKHPRPYLRVANVQRGYFNLREIKTIEVPDAQMPSYRLQEGDVLFVEGNGSRKELGRVAVWADQIPDCVHQNHLIKARLDRRVADPHFIEEWFNTEAGRAHFFRNAKTTSGLGTINSKEVKTAPVPLPDSVRKQAEIAGLLKRARAYAGGIRAKALKVQSSAWQDFINSIFS
jgi:type I restriction enzyme S subunit